MSANGVVSLEDLIQRRADAIANIMASLCKVPGVDDVYGYALREIVTKNVDDLLFASLQGAYLAARGTHKLDRLPKLQQYWRGRAQASADVRELESRLRAMK